jgi:hypothetical protein
MTGAESSGGRNRSYRQAPGSDRFVDVSGRFVACMLQREPCDTRIPPMEARDECVVLYKMAVRNFSLFCDIMLDMRPTGRSI